MSTDEFVRDIALTAGYGKHLKQRKKLLLSTRYGLNKSFSKTAVVGYILTGEYSFEPVVQINGVGATGVTLRMASWVNLRRNHEKIAAYFESTESGSEDISKNDPLDLDGLTISFTTAWGEKAVILTERDGLLGMQERTPKLEPLSKKYKSSPPFIVLQHITFNGLVTVAPCISEYLTELSKRSSETNVCKNELIKELATLANAHDLLDAPIEQITDLVSKKFDEKQLFIKSVVKPRFAKNYYKMTMLEIKALFTSELAEEIKAVLESTRSLRR